MSHLSYLNMYLYVFVSVCLWLCLFLCVCVCTMYLDMNTGSATPTGSTRPDQFVGNVASP